MTRVPRRLPCLLQLVIVAASSTLGASSLLAGAAASASPTTGFLSAPTDQLAVPGMLAGGEVTPEGDVYTGWAEYELRFGTRLRAWNQPTRTLPDPSVPELSSSLSDGSVLYTQTLFAVALAGRPVAFETVTATNRSGVPHSAQVAMLVAYTRGRQVRGAHGLATGAYRYERPVSGQPSGYYEQPGEPFSSAFAYSVAGRDLDRSGLLLARGPAAPSRPFGGLPPANTLTATHDARLFRTLLKAHQRVSYTWQIPLEPPPAGADADRALDAMPLSKARAQLARSWNTEEAGMTRIAVPERRVSDAYRAAIAEILSSRYQTPAGWVQGTNKLQYQAFWIRDAALQTQALDLVGLHSQAQQNLAFLDTFQRPDGLFISRAQQYDGLGQALWVLAQHAQLTQSQAFASAQLARMQSAIGWLSAATASDPLGLLPAGTPGDDELASGHITGDDLWAAGGLLSAIADATLAGRADLAAAWQAVDGRFESSMDSAIAAAVARAGHIPPVLDAAGGQDWGNYYAAYPVQVLGASNPAVKATLAWARAHMAQGLPTYANGKSLHDYLGFSVFQTELAAGDRPDAVAGLYAELAHTTSTDNGWEWDIPPFGRRATAVDLAPHGTFAADYVALLRNMLIADGPGRGVNLLSGASPAWLAPGQHIAVTDAPTDRGVVSFVERSTARGETLTWRGSFTSGTTLTWTLPPWARHATIAGKPVRGSTVTLPGASGTVAVTFAGNRPAQSYAATVVALNAAYRSRHRAAPLVPAAR